MKLIAATAILLSLSSLPASAIAVAPDVNKAVYDAVDFGAVGDGTTDDTSAIQKAIDEAASAGGGTVVLGRGKYRTTAPLRIDTDNVVFQGVGHGASVIWADGVDFHALVVGSHTKSAQCIGIRDLKVDRLQRANAEICNILIEWAGSSYIENVNISNGGDGIYVGTKTVPGMCGCISITRVWMGSTRRCLVMSNVADVTISHAFCGFTETGIYLTHCANNIRLTDSVFLTGERGKHGLLSDAGFMQEVRGCVFEETSEDVIKVNKVQRLFFRDNWLNANPDFPMVNLTDVDVFEVNNTRFGGSGMTSVELTNCTRGEVNGNHIESSRGIGIDIRGGANIQVSANQMGGNWVKGVVVSNGAQCIGVSNNHIAAGECAIHLMPGAGDKFIIKDNFLSKGKQGYILDESKAKTAIVKDNIEE